MATDPKPHAEHALISMLGDPVLPAQPLSFAAFLRWLDENHCAEWANHTEWVGGEVVTFGLVDLRRQRLRSYLLSVLATYLEWQRIGKVISGPFLMSLAHTACQPDLIVVATAHLDRLRHTYLDGPADLVVEIASPESVDRDHHVKLAEYAAAGIPEYLLIDPVASSVILYRLNPDGHYAQVWPQNGRLAFTALLGFWLDPAWLTQDPLPDEQATLLQIGGEPYRQYLLSRLG